MPTDNEVFLDIVESDYPLDTDDSYDAYEDELIWTTILSQLKQRF